MTPRPLGSIGLALVAVMTLIGAAADPGDRLADPAREAHARTLFVQVRCIVCQNESIDDSEAELAHDLRQTIRRQVSQGRSDGQIRAYLVERYGEFILLKPRLTLGNAPLWLAPFVTLLCAGAALLWRARSSRRSLPDTPALTPEEQARLDDLNPKEFKASAPPPRGA